MIIVLLNSLAFKYSLYWNWRWFDIPMHALGGFSLGFLALWAYVYFVKRGRWEELKFSHILFVSLVFALLVGGSWELIEVGLDELGWQTVTRKSWGLLQTGWKDTVGDLSSDALGALIATTFYYLISIWQKRKLQ